MKRVALLVMLVASSLWAQKVSVGYDQRVDFSQFKTYAWVTNLPKTTRPFMSFVITGAVDAELGTRGLTKVDRDPDILVAFHGGTDLQDSFVAEDPTFSSTGGAPAFDATGWSGSPSAAGPMVQKGTLVVDLITAQAQGVVGGEHLVWRGTAKANLDYEKKSKLQEQVNKAVEKMFKKYPPPKPSP
jgi:hypothetical protein